MTFRPRKCRREAIALLEVLVVVVVIVVFMALLLPTGGHHRHFPKSVSVCSSNLKQVGVAMYVYAGDHDGRLPTQREKINVVQDFPPPNNAMYFDRLLPYLGNSSKLLICPADTERSQFGRETNVFKLTNREISYFLNVDCNKTIDSLLSGDRNLTNNLPLARNEMLKLDGTSWVKWDDSLHAKESRGEGNILFGDGHVEYLSENNVREILKRNPTNSTRLLLPW